MSKPCKSCRELIDDAARKCPKCQAYQQWYRNPQCVTLLFLTCFIVFLIWNSLSHRIIPATFAAYKDKLSVSVVREEADGSSADGKRRLLTVQIDNRSDKTWKRPTFQILSLDKAGKIIGAEHVSDFKLVVAPHSSTLDTLTLRLVPAEPIAERKVSLTDIGPNLF